MLFYKEKETEKVVKAIALADSSAIYLHDGAGAEAEMHPLEFTARYELLKPQPEGFPDEPVEMPASASARKRSKES